MGHPLAKSSDARMLRFWATVSLLDKIIELATDNQQPLPVLLRQCIVLGHELKNADLKDWANHELNGYPDGLKVPDYRIVRAGATGTFNAGYMFPTIRRPIPAAILEETHRWAAETVHLSESVSAYETALKAESKGQRFVYQWNANLVGYYQDKFIDGHVLIDAWQEVSFGTIAGLLDTIRTRVLNMALDIKSEVGESDTDLKRVLPNSTEAENVHRIVINNIFGGNVYQGDLQNINIQNIPAGNWEELQKALLSFGIGQHDIDDLSREMQADGKTFGGRVKGWISRNASKVWDHGLQVSTSVGTTILTELAKQHYGIK
jgi:hypothetical protein